MRSGSSSWAAWLGIALPAFALADVTLRFDRGRGDCELLDRAGAPVLRCDPATNPSVTLGAKMVRKTVGQFVEYSFPDAGEITITPDGDALRISWKPRTASAAPTPAPSPGERPANALPATSDASGAPVDSAGTLIVPGAAGAAATGLVGPTAGVPKDENSALVDALKLVLPQYQKDVQDQYDYSIPESPGFTIIGMTPEDVVHPRTLRDFAVALKDGVDESGRFKTGIALDFTPLQWFMRDQRLSEYLRVDTGDLDLDSLRLAARQAPRRRYFNSNMLANTSVSIGATQGTGDGDESINLGIGLHVPIIDQSDGRERANECFNKTLFAKVKVASGGPIPKVLNADEVNKATSECLTPRWNDTIWTASLGYATTSEDGSFGDTRSGAYGIWSSFAYGFDGSPVAALRNNAQFILHARLINRQTVQDPGDDALLIEQDSESIGAAFKFGSDTLNAALQASYSRLKDRTHGTTDDVQKLSIGLEYRLAKDLWLVATLGGEGGRDNGKNNGFVLGSLKYGTASEPTGKRKK
jgi:hypothetical protein